MTFGKTLLIFVCALMLGLTLNAQLAVAADPPVDKKAFNQDDPKYQAEQKRLADPAAMDAAMLTKDNCPSGVCHKDTDPTVGFDTTPQMAPTGDAGQTTPTKTAPTKK